MKKIVQFILKILTKAVLLRFKPTIVGITGSVGKTSTKEAIYTVLSSKFRVRRNVKSYNTEIGVPLTILGLETARKSFFGWFKNFFKALGVILFGVNFPKILVIEMGASKPNDIKYLLGLIQPKIGIVTAVAPTHLEFFGQVEKVAQEKERLIKALPKEGTAILNFDDERVYAMKESSGGEVLTFGFGQGAAVRASNLELRIMNHESGISAVRGISFKVNYKGSSIPVRLAGVLGKQQVYAALPAIAVGLKFGMNLIEISESLGKYKAPAGRMNIIGGVKHTLIIDDTYNSSPTSSLAALETIEKLDGRKVVVLGDMLELGTYTEEGHRQVARIASQVADLIFTVGERAKFITDEARVCGFDKDKIFEFSCAEDAQKPLQAQIKKDDIILVKGSRAVHMEKIVKEIMAEPERAGELLVEE